MQPELEPSEGRKEESYPETLMRLAVLRSFLFLHKFFVFLVFNSLHISLGKY